MKTFIITAETNRPYAEGKAGAAAHRPTRARHGVTQLHAGEREGEARVMVVPQATARPLLDAMKATEAEAPGATGRVLDPTRMQRAVA